MNQQYLKYSVNRIERPSIFNKTYDSFQGKRDSQDCHDLKNFQRKRTVEIIDEPQNLQIPGKKQHQQDEIIVKLEPETKENYRLNQLDMIDQINSKQFSEEKHQKLKVYMLQKKNDPDQWLRRFNKNRINKKDLKEASLCQDYMCDGMQVNNDENLEVLHTKISNNQNFETPMIKKKERFGAIIQDISKVNMDKIDKLTKSISKPKPSQNPSSSLKPVLGSENSESIVQINNKVLDRKFEDLFSHLFGRKKIQD